MTTTLAATQLSGKRSKQGKNMASGDSLNHLLNFSLPPRNPPALPAPRRSKRPSTQHGVWNKEKFLNANYRFVMKPVDAGDYTVHFADPDIFFQWQDILQIIVPRTSALAAAGSSSDTHVYGLGEGHTTCPICLSPPRCARMTKCGHVYCYPCILHYLRTSDNPKWSRCPICFDSVNEKQLKAVKWVDAATIANNQTPDSPADMPRLGADLDMRLMLRPQITTLALPRSSYWPSDVIPPHQAPFHFMPDVFTFAKFMLATPAYLIADLTADIDELEVEKQDVEVAGDSLGSSFVDLATDKVRQQLAKAAALETLPLIQAIDAAHQNLEEHRGREKRKQESQRSYQKIATSDATEVPDVQSSTSSTSAYPQYANGRAQKSRRNVNPPPPTNSTYYYFQSASGSPIFLHPLDIRILLSHFHEYASFPNSITIQVEAATESTVNDDLRKRCKYLAHMPEAADVVFVEADLENIVGKEALKPFEGALKLRRSKRREKTRKDDRARLKAEEVERDKNIEAAYDSRLSQTRTVSYDRPQSPPLAVIDIAPPPSGAWGTRSFASTLNSAPSRSVQQRPPDVREDDWDLDAAWHDLEVAQRATGGKKKKSKLVLSLTGESGRRR